MSTLTFDQTFETAVAIASILMVLSGAWIIRVLIQIEKSKVVTLAGVLEDDGTSMDLEFEESTTSTSKHLEVEPADAGAIEMSPTRFNRNGGPSNNNDDGPASAIDGLPSTMPSSSPTSKPITARKARQRQRRISWMFVNMQIASLAALVLLTYLLLVVSNAPIFLRMVGSLCVFGMFLRYQIGDELRRQRIDRLMLLLSLFLLIASMLSTIVYSFKTLSQGEIYEGPARIVGYDMEQYNNSKHDPTTRTDMAVSWGKNWGCPMSGGKVCQSRIQGAMCQTTPAKEQTKHKPKNSRRKRKMRTLEDTKKDEDANQEEEALEEDLEDEEKSNQDLEDENQNLTKENEELEKEIEELKEENQLEDEENDSLVDEENSEIDELADEYDEDIMVVEEEMYEDAEAYEDAEYEEAEEDLENEIESTADDDTKKDLTQDLEDEEADQAELDEQYEEDEELLDEYADAYADAADESAEEFDNEQDTTDALENQLDDKKEEVLATEDEINDTKSKSKPSSSSGGGKHSTTDAPKKADDDNVGDDDVYEEIAEEVYEEEEEEVEEEYEEEVYEEEEEWYWDEYPENYDDDSYEDDYWDYDWDSVWGDYACEDLFDSDIGGQTFDPNTPPGGEDEWPFVNIYGSCKTCEAYILDYFAEEAFEETQEYKQQAIIYFSAALSGFVWSILSYIKYRVLPTAENEISLMGSDGGVMA